MPDDAKHPESHETLTATHWGTYRVGTVDGRVTSIRPLEQERDPAAMSASLADTLEAPARISQPMVRESYLRDGFAGGGAGRGREAFVPVDWDQALDLVAAELRRVKETHGNEAIFGGSYGWASAGRFHHAQSQIHRFLNFFGGYTKSVNSYSVAAAEVILPYVVGPKQEILYGHTWPTIAANSQLIVMFGGIPLKNAQVNPGGLVQHTTRDWLGRAAARGAAFVNIGPTQDTADVLNAEWLRPVPNSDTALLLALAHCLLEENLHDEAFLARYTVGFERFRRYLLGEDDGVAKDADWAAEISRLPAETIRALARRMAAQRTLITMSWSIQRGDHGEQPYWMAVVLAAMLGQIGLPGGGFAFGLGAMHGVAHPVKQLPWAALPQGENPVASFIPVARIADLLLNPGAPFDYNGQRHRYPDTRLVYWAGGNPFHHHQDLNRLRQAWQKPETVISNEIVWNGLARHSDIVLPVTTPLERNDIMANPLDGHLVAMHQAVAPVGQARSDFQILTGLAERLGFAERFTEGRDEEQWLRHLYDRSKQNLSRHGVILPSFEDFWAEGIVTCSNHDEEQVLLADFRADPEGHPLKTPSGKIEIFSETLDGFAYADCPGHPTWLEPKEWLGSSLAARFPLHLISDQPKTRLHSQLDHGAASVNAKVQDREPVRIHPSDAAARGIASGDIVRLFNDRGACLAGAVVSDRVMAGVVQLSTGAWYDPADRGEAPLEVHGNPNVLTEDRGTSSLAQGPIAQSALVQIERFEGTPPPVRAFTPPEMASG
jgi:biotin/methionine sulfoxide reductase